MNLYLVLALIINASLAKDTKHNDIQQQCNIVRQPVPDYTVFGKGIQYTGRGAPEPKMCNSTHFELDPDIKIIHRSACISDKGWQNMEGIICLKGTKATCDKLGMTLFDNFAETGDFSKATFFNVKRKSVYQQLGYIASGHLPSTFYPYQMVMAVECSGDHIKPFRATWGHVPELDLVFRHFIREGTDRARKIIRTLEEWTIHQNLSSGVVIREPTLYDDLHVENFVEGFYHDLNLACEVHVEAAFSKLILTVNRFRLPNGEIDGIAYQRYMGDAMKHDKGPEKRSIPDPIASCISRFPNICHVEKHIENIRDDIALKQWEHGNSKSKHRHNTKYEIKDMKDYRRLRRDILYKNKTVHQLNVNSTVPTKVSKNRTTTTELMTTGETPYDSTREHETATRDPCNSKPVTIKVKYCTEYDYLGGLKEWIMPSPKDAFFYVTHVFYIFYVWGITLLSGGGEKGPLEIACKISFALLMTVYHMAVITIGILAATNGL